MLGKGASFDEVNGSTIPQSWNDASKEIMSHGKPTTVMVIGEIDSGKTSFCTFLANMALKKRWKVAVIDADVGQSDIGPPSTIGFGHVMKPIKDLFDIEAENAYFVGSTSPSGAVSRVVEGLTMLKSKVLETSVDFLVINTDGWVDGEDATKYKVLLTQTVVPTVVVGIQQENELNPILSKLEDMTVFEVSSPSAIRKRSREKRKVLRELSYMKYLKKAKVQSFPFSWIKVEGAPFRVGVPPTKGQRERVTELLGVSPIYYMETPEAFFIVLGESQWVNGDRVKRVEERFGKRTKVIREGEEEGLLVALQNVRGDFLGIGILYGIDYKRKVMKVYAPTSENVSTICVGQIKLDKKGREIGLNPVFAD